MDGLSIRAGPRVRRRDGDMPSQDRLFYSNGDGDGSSVLLMTDQRRGMSKQSNRKLLFNWVLGMFILVLSVSGCASTINRPTKVTLKTEPTTIPKPMTGRGAGDVLRLVNPDTPTILNPHLSSSVRDWEASRIAYEPLASFDKDGVLVAFLAAEIPTRENGGLAADGKSVTWKLRKDVKWSDGNPFTADDVLFTFQFITNSQVKSTSATSFSAVDNVQVIDPLTVKVNFKNVNPAWALPFVGVQGSILPRHVFKDYNGANARQAPANTLPVGTGAYRVVAPGIKPQEVLLLGSQLVETNKIVYEPNPYFREADHPFFSQVEFRGGGMVNEVARQVFEDNSVDYAYNLGRLSVQDLATLSVSTRGRIVTNFGARVDRISLNRTDPRKETTDGERSSLQFPHPLFSDKLVRQAVAYAINREAIAAIYGSAGRPTNLNLISPPPYRSPNTIYPFDLKKAVALLDQAGWRDTNNDNIRDKNGVKMQVMFQIPANYSPQISKTVKDSLNSIGIDVQLKIVDSSIMFGACATNPDASACLNTDLSESSWRSVYPDPSAYMQNWTCAQIPQKSNNWSGNNHERYCNPEYDRLYQQSTLELDAEKRRQLFIQMNDLLVEDVVMIPVVYLADAQGVGTDIEGIDLTPWDSNTWNIKDWKRVTR